MPLCYVTDTLAYVYREADVTAFDCMADVIPMFSSIEQMLSPYLAYVYQEDDAPFTTEPEQCVPIPTCYSKKKNTSKKHYQHKIPKLGSEQNQDENKIQPKEAKQKSKQEHYA